MRLQRKLLFRTCVVLLMAMGVLVGAFNSRTNVKAAAPNAPAPANPTCYPSCAPNDPRMFSLAGDGLFTFGGGSTTMGIKVAGAMNPDSFVIGVFDGDGGGLWDQGSAQVKFEVLADPDADGDPVGGMATPLVLDTLDSGVMVNNGWMYFTVMNNPIARMGGDQTDYIYQLKATLLNDTGDVQNSFKIAVDSAHAQIFITPQVLSFQGFLNGPENPIIHPNGDPQTNPSNYDGKWNFTFMIENQTSINVWDGDFDIGNEDPSLGARDTDDLTTPNAMPDNNALMGALAFELNGAKDVHPEGLGTFEKPDHTFGTPGVGRPADNNYDGQFSNFFRRTPAAPNAGYGIVTRLIPPGGATEYLNNNPSGTNEYELFRVAEHTGTAIDSFNDYEVPSLKPGLWTYQIEGMDLANLFALRFDKILLVEPFMIGDLVFCDANGNKQADPGEGKAGVLVELVDANGDVVKMTMTNASGFYSFAVEPGTHKVRIKASNFDAGGVLEGLAGASVTGGNEKTDVVTDNNNFSYDFGYTCVTCERTIGDLVWEDLNGDGVRDANEPGLGGVTVDLFVSGFCNGEYALSTNQVTDASGAYSFTNLGAGCYQVRVNSPAGYAKTSGVANVNNNSQANPYVVVLSSEGCVSNLTADFGFKRQELRTCPLCDAQAEVVVDTPIKLDAKNLAATAGVLAPFASFDGSTITIDVGNQALHVTSKGSISVLAGASSQPAQFHQSGNHGTPNLTIKSKCTLVIDDSVRGMSNAIYRSLTGVIETNAQGGKAGDILLQFDGAITINGGVQSFQEKLPDSAASLSGAITIKSVCGEIRVGPRGWVVTWGENPGTKSINFIQSGEQDIVINGLVMNRTNHTIGGNPPPIININAVGGSVKIDGSNLVLDEYTVMGTKYDLTSGLLTLSREAADVGKINIQAKGNVDVSRNVTALNINRTSFAAVATNVNSNSPIGGQIRVRSFNGEIVAKDRAFEADGRGDNSKALIELMAYGNIWIKTPSAMTSEHSPALTTSSQNVNAVGKAGRNVLQSCTGTVLVSASASVLATGVSNTGVNQFTAGGGVTVFGTATPAAVGGGAACISPDPIP